MSFLSKFRSLELPVYDGRDINFYSGAVGKAVPSPGHDTLLRTIKYGELLDRSRSLKSAWDLADVVFAEAAETIGADVAWHRWGLKKRPLLSPIRNPEVLPKGYDLVAEVEVITGANNISLPEGRELEKRIRYARGDLPAFWTDPKGGQFVDGYSPRHSTQGRWLVDLDLFIDYREGEA
jgi:hypothetical protein